MWGWLDSVVDGLASIWQSISDIPSKIADKLSNFFSDLKDAILGLPDLILEGIKGIFIPDTAEIEAKLDATVDNISSQLGVQFNTLDRLFDREVAPEDVTEEYNLPGVGKLQLKFFDTDFLISGIAMMRPYIRGFLVLLLIMFVWRQVITLIGQDPGIAAHSYNEYKSWKEGDK